MDKKLHTPWPAPLRRKWKASRALSFSWRDFTISTFLYLGTVLLCLVMRQFDPNNETSYVAVIFLLDVFLTAMLTNGYIFSTVVAVLGVFSVDYIFTAPYWAVSFTVTGFPLTFIVMMTISVATGAVMSRAKQRDALEREAEQQRVYADLLRAVSHDIRTPLTGIVGATGVLLEQDLTPEQQRELLTYANEDAQWLIRVVENLLSITRMGGEGEKKLNKVEALAEEVVEDAAAKFRKRYPKARLELHLPEEVRLVPMEELLIVQVLLNLMENAVLHGGPTMTKIDLSLHYGGGMAVFTIADDGAGIPRQKLDSLFEGVSEDHRSDKRRSMGIGLSVCRSIIRAHGGAISGANGAHGGAVFTVTIPLEEENHEDQRQSSHRRG